MKEKNELGQYFTTNKKLKKTILKFIKNNPKLILEPSIGQGDLVKYINKKLNIKFDMYEIDKNIKLLKGINKKEINYTNFLETKIDKLYKTIIGNPPYIRTKSGNLYIDFIKKCYNLLDKNGELIFIVPSDFLKLTSSVELLNEMLLKGSFTHIYHPEEENLFENANINIIIFRYQKDIIKKKIKYNSKKLYLYNSNGLITFSHQKKNNMVLFKNYFHIYVGIVSGKDDIYKNELGNISVLTSKLKEDKYIFIKSYPSDNKKINEYLLKNKNILLQRKIRKFNDKNWFEWGAPRNIKTIEENKGKECIYIYNLTRKKEIAFKDKVKYFGGNLLILIPKYKLDLDKIVKFLNSDDFKINYIFSGRFKIGHRQISNSYLDKSLI